MINKILDIVMKLLIGATFILAIMTIIYPDMIKQFLDWMKVTINSLGNWNYLIVFLSSLIEGFPVLGIVVPGQNILLIVGGFFADISYTNLFYVIIITSFGAVISNYIGYYLGIYYGDTFFKKYGLRFGIGETEVKYLKKGIKKWGAWGIIIGKFHNIARAFVPFIAGTMGMHRKQFFVYNVIGSILRSIAMVILGTFFAANYEVIIDYFGYIVLIITLLVAVYIYLYKKEEFIKYWKEKEAEIERKI